MSNTLDQITLEEVYAQEEEKMIKALAEAEEQEQERQKSSEEQEEAVQEQQIIREVAAVISYIVEKPITDAYTMDKTNHEASCGCCKEW